MSFERAALLREMGLGPLWRLRSAVMDGKRTTGAAAMPSATVAAEVESATGSGSAMRKAVMVQPGGQDAPGPIPRELRAFAAATTGQRQGADARPKAGQRDVDFVDEPGRADRISGMDWSALEDDMRACKACRLCQGRNQAVPGVGDRSAEWMFVGEGPGAEEDRRGEPFVGAAGKLLDEMLAAIGLARDQRVFIANAVKCRPPLNRTPQADEIAACQPYLSRQIALVRPRLLIALGRPAAQALLGEEVKINASRGRLFHREGTPVVVTYHPAYLLRNQADKARAWEDLCFARKALAELKRQDA